MIVNEIIAHQRLAELFQRTAIPWEWDEIGNHGVSADFVVGGIEYRFFAYNPGRGGSWDVEFGAESPGGEASKYAIIGTGNAAIVMSTIVEILSKFLKMKGDRVTQLTFSANEPSRQKLYMRMVSRLLPNWSITQHGAEFKLTSPDHVPEFDSGD